MHKEERKLGFNLSVRAIVIIVTLVYIILLSIYIRVRNTGLNSSPITIYVPWSFIAIFISLYTFYEYNRVRKLRRKERLEERKERRQELLDNILKSGKRKSDTPTE
jgi:hypothetical protein